MKPKTNATPKKVLATDVVRSIVTLAFFSALAAFLLGTAIKEPYGFAAARDSSLLMSAVTQAFPLIACLLSMFAVGIADRRVTEQAKKSPGVWRLFVLILLAALALAAPFFLASYLIWASFVADAGGIISAGSGWIWGGYAIDLVMLMILSQFIHALTRRWYLSILIFFAYCALTWILASKIGDIGLLGFATTPVVTLTGYDNVPIGMEAALAWRGYWALIALALVVILACFDRRPYPLFATARSITNASGSARLTGLACTSIIVVAALGVAFALTAKKATVSQRYPRAPDVLSAELSSYTVRPTVVDFDISLHAVSPQRIITVEGTLKLVNLTQTKLSVIAFEKAQLLRLSAFAPDREHRLSTGSSGRMLLVQLEQPLLPGDTITVSYFGKVDAEDIFDKVARTAVFDDAFFLGTASVLPLPKNPACFAQVPDSAACGMGENYLSSDPSRGRITATVRKGIVIAGAQRVADDRHAARYVISVEPGALSNFLIAAAPFQIFTRANTVTAPMIDIYTAPYSRSPAVALADYIAQELDAYRMQWSHLPLPRFWLIETPAGFSDAIAYRGGAAISELHLNRVQKLSRVPGATTKMILSHEIAHQWWGYALVPTKGPGTGLVLESFPQFSATDRLRRQGLITRERVISTETSNVKRAMAESHQAQPALSRIEESDWRAYHAGPLALTRLDQISGGELITHMGKAFRANVVTDGGTVDPGKVIDALIRAHPEPQRSAARALLDSSYDSRLVTAPTTREN